jgi:hypothetical protein
MESSDPVAHLIVLLGGEAGLRCGEMMALEWADAIFRNDSFELSGLIGRVTAPRQRGRLWVLIASRIFLISSSENTFTLLDFSGSFVGFSAFAGFFSIQPAADRS